MIPLDLTHRLSDGDISQAEYDNMESLYKRHQDIILEARLSDSWICSHSTWIRAADISAIEDCGCSSPVFHLNNGTCVYQGVIYPNVLAVATEQYRTWAEVCRREGGRSLLASKLYPEGICLTEEQRDEISDKCDAKADAAAQLLKQMEGAKQ